MKEQPKITVDSYVHKGDKLVKVEDLTPEERVKVATWIKVTYLNEIFRGKAVFSPRKEAEPQNSAS